jgi:kynurenine formamidase
MEDADMEDFRVLGSRVRNWGKWGAEDQRGTVNYITPQKMVEAGKLIRTGKVFDLGIPFDSEGPQPGGGRINPVHLMSQTGDRQMFPGGFRYADDYIFMPLQGASQWDALSHVYYDDQLYNGFPSNDVTVVGAFKCGIEHQAKGIAGRGVLLDLARLKGVDWMEKGYAITPDDLDAALAAQGVAIGSGDILVFRTGWRKKFLVEKSPTSFMDGEPGLGQGCCEWLHAREIAAVCSDNWAIEVLPGENPDATFNVHMVLIRDMGMTLGEILDLEELAADCAADGVYEFFFCAPPLKVTGGVGSPINPLAIK